MIKMNTFFNVLIYIYTNLRQFNTFAKFKKNLRFALFVGLVSIEVLHNFKSIYIYIYLREDFKGMTYSAFTDGDNNLLKMLSS